MSFKEILKNTDNQILKGLILKVKNESMKKDIKFSDLRKNLLELMEYDEKVFFDVIKLVTRKKSVSYTHLTLPTTPYV